MYFMMAHDVLHAMQFPHSIKCAALVDCKRITSQGERQSSMGFVVGSLYRLYTLHIHRKLHLDLSEARANGTKQGASGRQHHLSISARASSDRSTSKAARSSCQQPMLCSRSVTTLPLCKAFAQAKLRYTYMRPRSCWQTCARHRDQYRDARAWKAPP